MGTLQTSSLLPTDRTGRLLVAVAGVLLCGYALQVFAPLRIDTDSMYYLSIGASFSEGNGLMFYQYESEKPIGYPVVAGILDAVGLGHAPGLVGANLVFLVLAVWVLLILLRGEQGSSPARGWGVVVLLLSMFALIKYFPRPRAEVLGLFSTWLVLLGIIGAASSSGRRKAVLLIGCAVGVFVAIQIRLAAAALLPALAWALLPRDRGWVKRIGTRAFWFGLAGFAVLVAVLVYWGFSSTMYEDFWLQHNQYRTPSEQAAYILYGRSLEMGEIIFNAPSSAIPGAAVPLVQGAGALVFILILSALWIRRRAWSPADIFVAANIGILLLWPGMDPRFWLPAFPFAALYIMDLLGRMLRGRAFTAVATLYLATFVSLGLGIQFVLTQEAFSEDFAQTYGDGTLSRSYEAVIGGPEHHTVEDTRYFNVLLRFDSRASPDWDRSRYPAYYVAPDE